MTTKNVVSAMNLAAALDNAMLLREKSFDSDTGEYRRQYIHCAKEACDNVGIDQIFAGIIVLALVGTWNEAEDWIKSMNHEPSEDFLSDIG